MPTLIIGTVSGVAVSGWILLLAWSLRASTASFSELNRVERAVLIGSWALVPLGTILHYAFHPLFGALPVGFGTAGIIYTLFGGYPRLTQGARMFAAGGLIVGTGVEIISEGLLLSLPGPLTFASLFFLIGWLLLQTLFSFKAASLLKKVVYVVFGAALFASLPVPVLSLAGVAVLSLTLPPPTRVRTGDETIRTLRTIEYICAISLLIGAALGAVYSITSGLYYLLGSMVTPAGILGVMVLAGVYWRKRILIIVSGLFALVFSLFGFLAGVGPYPLVVAVAVLTVGLATPLNISGLLMPSSRDSSIVLRGPSALKGELPGFRAVLLLIALVISSIGLSIAIVMLVDRVGITDLRSGQVELEDVSDQAGFDVYVPKELLNGMKFDEAYVNVEGGIRDVTLFYAMRGESVSIVQSRGMGIGIDTGKPDDAPEEPKSDYPEEKLVRIKGRPGLLVEAWDGRMELRIQFANCTVVIKGPLSEEEIISLAKSLRKQRN